MRMRQFHEKLADDKGSNGRAKTPEGVSSLKQGFLETVVQPESQAIGLTGCKQQHHRPAKLDIEFLLTGIKTKIFGNIKTYDNKEVNIY